MPELLSYVLAFACVSALSIGAAHAASRLTWRAGAIAAGLAVAALVAAALAGIPPGSPWVLLTSVLLLVAGSDLGALVGARVEEPGHLLPVAVVSSLVDLASVLHPAGPSARVVGSPGALALLAVWFPLIVPGKLAPILGVGDVVFCGLYLAAARRHRLSAGLITAALAAGLVSTMILVVITELPLPALPLLGAAVLVAEPRARRVPAPDRRRAWAVMIGLALVVAILLAHRWYGATR